METYKNFSQTTLNGGIDNVTTSVVVTNAVSFPTTGIFRILIDSEIMRVTGVSSNTFTVVRGTEGTTAASHSNSVNVYGILTEAAFKQIRVDSSEKLAVASFSAGKSGRLLVPSDAGRWGVDKGSSIVWYGQIWRMKPPNMAEFSWVNQGGATYTTFDGFLHISEPTAVDGNVRILCKPQPATPFSIKAYIIPLTYYQDFNGIGIGFRESATSKIEKIRFVHSTVDAIEVIRRANETGGGTGLGSIDIKKTGEEIRWLQIRNDGTNLYYEYSSDGYFFYTLRSHAKNQHFTTAPDQVMITLRHGTTSHPAAGSIFSWDES